MSSNVQAVALTFNFANERAGQQAPGESGESTTVEKEKRRSFVAFYVDSKSRVGRHIDVLVSIEIVRPRYK